LWSNSTPENIDHGAFQEDEPEELGDKEGEREWQGPFNT
jgi:hypothetical protein